MSEWLEQEFLHLATKTSSVVTNQSLFFRNLKEDDEEDDEGLLSDYLKKPDEEKSLVDGVILIS